MRKLVTNVMMDIIGNVTRGDASEKAIILKNRLPLIDLDCYETAARFFSRHCFSIAKVSMFRWVEGLKGCKAQLHRAIVGCSSLLKGKDEAGRISRKE